MTNQPAALRTNNGNTLKIDRAAGKRLAGFITVPISRHADFGGGTILADLPDTPYHRHTYGDKIVRQWSEWLDI